MWRNDLTYIYSLNKKYGSETADGSIHCYGTAVGQMHVESSELLIS